MKQLRGSIKIARPFKTPLGDILQRPTVESNDTMRFDLVATLAAVLVCSQVCEASTTTPDKSAAFVYLHPAQRGNGRPSNVSPPQIHRILSNHLNVPKDGEEDYVLRTPLDIDAWDWLSAPPVMYKGKEVLGMKANDDQEKQRTLVLLSGLDEVDLDEVMPNSLRNTHVVVDAPHPSSFEALADAYGQQIYSGGVIGGGAVKAFTGFFTAAVEGMEHALEGAADWLIGHGTSAFTAGMQFVDQTNVADEASRTFYEGLRNFVSYMDKVDSEAALSNSPQSQHEAASYHALRLDGLDQIKSTYGQESQEFQRAKQALRDLLHGAVKKFDSLHDRKPQSFALVVVPSAGTPVAQDEAGMLQKRNRLLLPFRGNIVVTPFLATSSNDDAEGGTESFERRQISGSVLKSKPTKKPNVPKDSDLASQCFKSDTDLNKASQNCTGHGTAVQTSRGGRKCYRCKCQTSKAKNGKLTDWTGEACQRQSIAKPFALLAVTTLVLLVVSYASVYFLFYEGAKELPSVLAGISIPSKSR